VFEFVQDFYGDASPATRAVRGGNFTSTPGPNWIETTVRKYAFPGNALDILGFRIARVAGAAAASPGDFDADGDVDLTDYAAFVGCATGPVAGEVPSGCDAFDFDLDGNIDLADFRGFQCFFMPPP
jgi:hypothetical protein